MNKTEDKKQGIVFITRNCFDLVISAAGIMAKIGHALYVIDACQTGELFQVLSGYGGRTDRMVAFRQADYILCNSPKELRVFLSLKGKERPNADVWIYVDPESFRQNREQYREYKKIVLADSFFHMIKEITDLAREEKFQADLLIVRGLPGKKINFSYLCRVYKKEFSAFEKILELPWAEEDLEYRVRLGYERSQGFFRLSDGYHNAIEYICMESGERGQEIKKVFRTFEKNGR